MSHVLASVGPYIVIFLVVVVFFVLCVFLFKDKPKKAKGKALRAEVASERAYYKPQDRRNLRSDIASAKTGGLGDENKGVKAPQANPVAVGRGSTASTARGLSPQVVTEPGRGLGGPQGAELSAQSMEHRAVGATGLATSETPAAASASTVGRGNLGATASDTVGAGNSNAANIGNSSTATGLGLGARVAVHESRSTNSAYTAADGSTIDPSNFGNNSEGLSPAYIEHVTAQCAQRYPFLSREGKKQLKTITEGAFERVGLSSVGQTQALLENVIVQEALYRMQEAYLTTPTEWMYKMAVEAFADVVQRPKSSPIYLLAIDALHLLSQLSLGHFQAISVALLLQSTRNSNNVTQGQWQRYLEKYILPFTEALPRDDAMYKQLLYVRCFEDSGDHVPLYALLARMYPYVFAYDGFSKEELNKCLAHEHLDGAYVVSSMNSSLLKFAVINHEYMPLVFEQNDIVDEAVREGLLTLATSRPSRLSGNDLRALLADLSPIMPSLMKLYDNSPLCRSQLTSLGLYVGRLHVKAVIDHDFDISDWI